MNKRSAYNINPPKGKSEDQLPVVDSKTVEHVPVLLEEAVTLLNVRPDRIYIDATAGAGGHLQKICSLKGTGVGILALDRIRMLWRNWAVILTSKANFQGFALFTLILLNWRQYLPMQALPLLMVAF